jgi:hypothetical protein
MAPQQPEPIKGSELPLTKKLRKWHFLLLGSTLVLLSAFLWYWNWRILGIPKPLRAEHFITIATYLIGIVVLAVFIYRLTRQQVTIMLVGMIIVNFIAALLTAWILRTYPTFFELVCPFDLSAYDPEFITNWRVYFLTPALYAMHAGLILLWIVSLVMFLIRKPGEQPG